MQDTTAVAVEDPGHEPHSVTEYRSARQKADELFVRLSPYWRLQLADLPTEISFLGCLGFFGWWTYVRRPFYWVAELQLIPSAHAAGSTIGGMEMRDALTLGVFVMLFLMFILSAWAYFFGKNERGAEAGGTVAKMLLGLFLGIATRYFDIASPS